MGSYRLEHYPVEDHELFLELETWPLFKDDSLPERFFIWNSETVSLIEISHWKRSNHRGILNHLTIRYLSQGWRILEGFNLPSRTEEV